MAEMMKGNEAIAEAAVRAGVKFYAGYPITPSSEIMEYLSWRLPEVGGSFVQAESELAGINMVIGAAASGVRGPDRFLRPRHIPETGRRIHPVRRGPVRGGHNPGQIRQRAGHPAVRPV